MQKKEQISNTYHNIMWWVECVGQSMGHGWKRHAWALKIKGGCEHATKPKKKNGIKNKHRMADFYFLTKVAVKYLRLIYGHLSWPHSII